MLVPHELRDHPAARPLIKRAARVQIRGRHFPLPDGQTCSRD